MELTLTSNFENPASITGVERTDQNTDKPQNLVFVDQNISEISSIIQGIEDASVVVLKDNTDGILAVTQVLEQYQDLASVHFISHGQSASIQLGNATLDSSTLEQYAPLMSKWGQATTANADFLFYGCNVAANTEGQDFIHQLSHTIGADIAASDDLTGAAALMGDWKLEAHVGTIEATSAINAATIATYGGTLDSALLVAGDSTLGQSDLALQSRLEALGFSVTIQDDQSSRSSDAAGHDLVFISESVSSGRVNTKFTDVAVPIITTEAYLYDDLALTQADLGSDYGIQGLQTSVTITEPASPLAAGLTGEVTAFALPNDINWGVPNANAITAGVLTNGSDRSTIFAYDKDATLTNGEAAQARRVGLFIGSNADQLTAEGWQLFDAAVDWATVAPTPTPPPIDVDAPTATASAANIVAAGGESYEFTVNYTDATAVNVSTLDSTDILVTGPNGFSQPATLVSVSSSTDVPSITATYAIAAPGRTWDTGDNGTFEINWIAGEVADTLGFANEASLLDQFEVNISNTPPPPPADAADILFVAGNTSLSISDQAIRQRLEQLGHTVTVIDDGLSNSDNALGQDLVFISESVSSRQVGNKFSSVNIPVIASEAFVFDDMGMTSTIRNISYEVADNATTLAIAPNANPDLTAGLSGDVTVFDPVGEIAWGDPNANAAVIGTLPNQPDRAGIFAYDTGAILENGNVATDRRIGFFIGADAQNLSANGWSLFEASVNWALADAVDEEAPTASVLASDLVVGEGSIYEFTVTYTDSSGVDFSTLGTSDVRVTGPNGFDQVATLGTVSASADAPTIRATYSITAPGGTWGTEDNGTFSLALEAGEVADTLGNVNGAIALGQFDVNISDSAGILQLAEPTEYRVSEGDGFVTIEFLRTSGSAGTATLNYATVDLTGTPDEDYAQTIGQIVFAPGETSKTVDIQIFDDNDPETDETFGIGLTEGEGATLGAPRTALVTIIDNDSPNQPSASANVLFVAGSPNLSESDQVIRQEFERLGHVVTVQDDDLSSTADVANQDLVFVSESVVSRKVGDTFSRVDIPVISAEAYIFDDMAWTETALNADFGTLASATRLVIDSTATTELTAGLTGEVTVFNPTGEIAWGNPNANATTVATLPNNGDRAGIFTYEAGASLVDGSTASSRQAGFFLGADAQNLSPEGWNLFAATVSWALGTPLEITPELAFASSNTTVDEGDGTATVTVRRLGDTSQQIQVDYGTSDDSAEAGLDYTTTSGTLVFNPGVATLTIEVPILEDSDSELNESFNLTLSNPVGIDLGATTTATVTINDNDNSTVINNGDFVRETIASGLFLPTAFDWIPGSDTILVAEKDGLVKVVQDGVVQATPLLDLTERVNNAGDRGLGGLAVHPDFANTPYVYLAYTLDPPETQSFPDDRNSKPDGRGNRPSQVIRITVSMDPVTNAVSVVPDSEVILLGNNSLWEFTTQGNSTAALGRPQSGIAEDGSYIEDYLVTDSLSHSVGMLQFGTDGSLFVANGDGASFNFADPRAVRVQDIDSLSGKILRVDPITGEGLGDNPFFNGDPNSNRSKVHSYGLRNPFRFAINKDTNTPYIGDVGWTQWEEINTGVGVNYGWPYYEGGDNEINLPTSEYDQLPEAQAFYASGELATAPIFAIDHEGRDAMRAIIMGDFYDGTAFPNLYDDALFFAGFQNGNVYYMTFDANNEVDTVNIFDTDIGGIVQMTTGVDSNLYYLNLFEGSIGRWSYQAAG